MLSHKRLWCCGNVCMGSRSINVFLGAKSENLSSRFDQIVTDDSIRAVLMSR